MEIIHEYQNGNTNVVLYSDGTKHRYTAGNPKPTHPESIDVKITNYCDAACGYCHEMSTVTGQHADLDTLLKRLEGLPAGVELAIGGGNPLSHPGLVPFLQQAKHNGWVANITVSQRHIDNDILIDIIDRKLVHGVGVSCSSDMPNVSKLRTDNLVFHLIAGINNINQINQLKELCVNKLCKVLVLGYKNIGRGIKYQLNNNIKDNQYSWYIKIGSYLKYQGLVLSFDNLAIDQLKLRRFFTDVAWNEFYMGDDFTYTCYVDAVKQEYAPSSTSLHRKSFNDYTLLEYFGKFKNDCSS